MSSENVSDAITLNITVTREQWEKIKRILGPVPDVGSMTVNRPATRSTAPVRDHKGKAAKMQGF